VNAPKPAPRRPAGCRRIFLGAALAFIILGGVAPAADNDPAAGWQRFERQVRDERISEEEGVKEIGRWKAVLERAYPAGAFEGPLFFPLRGYGPRHIGGRRGEGYKPSRYRFLGPRRRIGHPAQDIFVYDGNQDSLDDRTGAPVEVVSLTEGIVASTFSGWTPAAPPEPQNGMRGGNYIWIYHPALRLFAYYAHLADVKPTPGERVAGGETIATLGRTGTNASRERSPTHLHLMLLKAGDMSPTDPYPYLTRAKP
jgi:hypothetical protein